MYTWVIIHKLSVYKAIAQTAGTLEVYPSIPDTLGTASSVLIKGGILISGVVLYSVLCTVAGTVHGVLIEGDVFILGYPYRGVPLYSH